LAHRRASAACSVAPAIRATGERLGFDDPIAVPALSITAKVDSIDLGPYREGFGFRGIASLFPA
jgi:hypothetical protein